MSTATNRGTTLRCVSWLVWIVALLGSPAEGGDTRALATACADYYADLYRVPRELVYAVIEVESKWRPDAVSPVGAVGLMQLMPATAVTFGVRNRFQIADNIQGGVAYLAQLMSRFGGDLRLVTAAYLVGERRVRARGLDYSSPVVCDYVNKVARVYRKRKLEAFESR